MVKEEYGNGAGRIANADGASSDNLEPEQFRKIFIGGLSSVTDENSMKSFYEQYGTVIDCVVMRDPQTKRSRGFGFVSFTSMDGVDAAMSNRPHEIDGKTVDPKRAVPREDSSRGQKLPSTNRLYVSGVREGHTEEMLKEYFSQFGTVEKVEIMMDKATGKPRGFGFITFDDYDPVDKCVLKKSHTINDYRCDVKKGLSKEEMAKVQQGDRDRSARGERSGGWGGSRGQPMGWGAGGDRPVYGSGGQTWGQGGWGGAGGPSGAPRGGYEQSGWGQGYGGGQGGYGGGYSGGGQAGYSGGGQGGYGGAGYGGYGGQGGGWGQQQQQGDPWRRNY